MQGAGRWEEGREGKNGSQYPGRPSAATYVVHQHHPHRSRAIVIDDDGLKMAEHLMRHSEMLPQGSADFSFIFLLRDLTEVFDFS